MATIRVGLLGLGGMANSHLEQIRKVGDMAVVAVCDSDAEKTRQWGQRLGVQETQRYTDYKEIMADPDIDAIISATPNNIHYRIVEAALRSGKPLMAEKPFTRTYDEASRLKAIAEEEGADCFVGFSYRYVPSYRMAREWIKDGKIGTVRHVSVQYLQDWGVPLFGTPMNWRWELEITGTGVLHDLAAHMIDAVRFLIAEPTEVNGLMSNLISERPAASGEGTVLVDIDDFAAFTLILEGGIPAVCQTSRNAYGCGNQFELSIYGDLGSLHIGYEFGEQMVWTHQHEETGRKTREEIQVPECYKLLQMQDFAHYATGSKDEWTPRLQDGYRNQLVLEAVIRSAQQGRTIRLDEVEAAVEAKGV